MDSFVLIEAEGAYSDRDWKVRGVFSDEEFAILNAFKILVNHALKPWIIEFYKDRKGEFSNATSLPELHIEHWTLDNKKIKNIYIGFQDRPFRHFIDAFLKKTECENKNYEDTVLSWNKELNNNIIPKDLLKFIKIDKEK